MCKRNWENETRRSLLHFCIQLEQCGGSGHREKINYREILKVKLTDFEDKKYMWSKGGVNVTDISSLLDTSTYVSSSLRSSYHLHYFLTVLHEDRSSVVCKKEAFIYSTYRNSTMCWVLCSTEWREAVNCSGKMDTAFTCRAYNGIKICKVRFLQKKSTSFELHP